MVKKTKRFQLNQKDLIKIMTGLGIALTGALLTYVTELIPNVDFGTYTPIVVSIWSVIANVIRKYIANK